MGTYGWGVLCCAGWRAVGVRDHGWGGRMYMRMVRRMEVDGWNDGWLSRDSGSR